MTDASKYLGKKFVGNPVEIGKSSDRYESILMADEKIYSEYKGIRDACVFTNYRIIVIDPQGLMGKKVSLHSIPYKSITAYSVENSGTFDLDAELKLTGSGFGLIELQFTKGTDVKAICKILNEAVLVG